MEAAEIATQLSQIYLHKAEHIDKNNEDHQTPSKLSFLTLPPELRLLIYSFATNNQIGFPLVQKHSGRLQFRLAWPFSPLDYRSPQQLSIDTIACTSSQVRHEMLPIIMRGFIVKFPAWTPEFKVQCLHWIGDVSELFCRCIDWIWFEGLYWRISVIFGNGTKRGGMIGEDERARRLDVHMHELSESFERQEFTLRVDYQRSAEDRAVRCARRTIELLNRLVADAGGACLGKKQMEIFLHETPLTGTEQHRVGLE